jgi:hypothetical protein
MIKKILACACRVALVGLLLPHAAKSTEAVTPQKLRMVKAWLEVKPAKPDVLHDSSSKIDPAEFSIYKRSLAVMVKSPLVLATVLEDKEIQSLPSIKNVEPADREQALAARLVVEFPGDATVMTIGMRDDANHDAVKIVRATVDALEKKVVDADRNADLQRVDQLEIVLTKYKKTLAEKRSQLTQLAGQLGDPDRALLMQAEISNLENSIGKAQFAKATAEVKLAHAKQRLAQVSEENPNFQTAQSAVASAELDITEWSNKIGQFRDIVQTDFINLESLRGDSTDTSVLALKQEIGELGSVTQKLSENLDRGKINVRAPSRVRLISPP